MSGYPMGDMSYQQQPIQQQYQQQGYIQYGQQPNQWGPELRPGQPPPPNSEHYGAYGQQFHQNVYQTSAWQCLGSECSSEQEFMAFFDQHKSPRFSAIQAEELMHILNQTPSIKAYYGITWSLELCKIMIAMLDRSKDGMMQYPEFRELLQCLNFWYQVFVQYDTNRTGYMEASELGRCIQQRLQYRLSPKAFETLLKRYARAVERGPETVLLIAFDDFVSCLVRLRAYTEAFRARDRAIHQNQETGSCQFDYDDFLQVVMCL